MKTTTMLKTSYLIGISTILSGAMLKLQKTDAASYLLTIGMIATLLFMITAIIEVNRSQKITEKEKGMWTVGLLFLSGIVGLVYLIKGRRRIV